MLNKRTRILLTAFEPFGANDTNISQKVLDAIQADVAKLLLPVSFRRAPEDFLTAIANLKPNCPNCPHNINNLNNDI